jgi:hypothetical protein
MTKNSVATGIDRRALISGMTAVSALGGALSTAAQAQTTITSGTFSFAACGDSRPMMHLPYKEGKPDLVKLFVEMFGLVMPERVAEEVVKRDVKMIFDPATKDLVEVIMPFMSKTEVMTLSIDKGWVMRASTTFAAAISHCGIRIGANLTYEPDHRQIASIDLLTQSGHCRLRR